MPLPFTFDSFVLPSPASESLEHSVLPFLTASSGAPEGRAMWQGFGPHAYNSSTPCTVIRILESMEAQ